MEEPDDKPRLQQRKFNGMPTYAGRAGTSLLSPIKMLFISEGLL